MELLSAAEDMCYSQGSIRTKCRVGLAAAEKMEAVAVEETTAVAAEGILTIAAEEMTAVISGEMASGRR